MVLLSAGSTCRPALPPNPRNDRGPSFRGGLQRRAGARKRRRRARRRARFSAADSSRRLLGGHL